MKPLLHRIVVLLMVSCLAIDSATAGGQILHLGKTARMQDLTPCHFGFFTEQALAPVPIASEQLPRKTSEVTLRKQEQTIRTFDSPAIIHAKTPEAKNIFEHPERQANIQDLAFILSEAYDDLKEAYDTMVRDMVERSQNTTLPHKTILSMHFLPGKGSSYSNQPFWDRRTEPLRISISATELRIYDGLIFPRRFPITTTNSNGIYVIEVLSPDGENHVPLEDFLENETGVRLTIPIHEMIRSTEVGGLGTKNRSAIIRVQHHRPRPSIVIGPEGDIEETGTGGSFPWFHSNILFDYHYHPRWESDRGGYRYSDNDAHTIKLLSLFAGKPVPEIIWYMTNPRKIVGHVYRPKLLRNRTAFPNPWTIRFFFICRVLVPMMLIGTGFFGVYILLAMLIGHYHDSMLLLFFIASIGFITLDVISKRYATTSYMHNNLDKITTLPVTLQPPLARTENNAAEFQEPNEAQSGTNSTSELMIPLIYGIVWVLAAFAWGARAAIFHDRTSVFNGGVGFRRTVQNSARLWTVRVEELLFRGIGPIAAGGWVWKHTHRLSINFNGHISEIPAFLVGIATSAFLFWASSWIFAALHWDRTLFSGFKVRVKMGQALRDLWNSISWRHWRDAFALHHLNNKLYRLKDDPQALHKLTEKERDLYSRFPQYHDALGQVLLQHYDRFSPPKNIETRKTIIKLMHTSYKELLAALYRIPFSAFTRRLDESEYWILAQKLKGERLRSHGAHSAYSRGWVADKFTFAQALYDVGIRDYRDLPEESSPPSPFHRAA